MANATPVRRLFFEILTFFAKTYADIFGLTTGPPTHDPLAVAAVFRPDLFTFNATDRGFGDRRERFSISVVTQGAHGSSAEIRNGPSQCGRTVALPQAPGEAGILIPRGLDSQALWSMIEACLTMTELAAINQQQGHAAGLGKARGASLSDLVGDPHTTLSQLEMAGGIPDIRINKQSPSGEHIRTAKPISPMDLGSTDHTSEAQDASEGMQRAGAL
jgi:hypothetical protein